MNATMFEQASRLRLRFYTPRGSLSIEDLWDLPLTSSSASLDDIAIGLRGKIEGRSVSFVSESRTDDVDELKFEIVKHVIDVRLAEKKSAEEAQNRATQKQHILSIIARKEDAALEGKTLDELRELIGDL